MRSVARERVSRRVMTVLGLISLRKAYHTYGMQNANTVLRRIMDWGLNPPFLNPLPPFLRPGTNHPPNNT
eukprot:scaffold575_cov83-Skeletonema_marinoi.AAC.1